MPNTKSAKSSTPNNGAKHSPVKSFKETRGIVGAPQPPGAYKLRGAAAYLSLSIPTLHRLCARGLLKPCRATRHLLFSKKELDRFLST
jgi:hypothetical protein